jgi:hypothetical protein
MDVSTSEVSYTSVTTGRGGHEVHKGHVVALGKKKKKYLFHLPFAKYIPVSRPCRIIISFDCVR